MVLPAAQPLQVSCCSDLPVQVQIQPVKLFEIGFQQAVLTICHLHALHDPPDGLLLRSNSPDAICQLLNFLGLQNQPLQQGG
jgi:hypothetical protein